MLKRDRELLLCIFSCFFEFLLPARGGYGNWNNIKKIKAQGVYKKFMNKNNKNYEISKLHKSMQ